MKKRLIKLCFRNYTYLILLFVFSYSNILHSQDVITSSLTSNYTPVESTDDLANSISRMFQNENIQTEFFQILGELGDIKLAKGVIYSKLNFEEELVEGGLDLMVVRAFMGLEGGKRRSYIGLGGKIGSIDVNLEIDFKPGMMAITSATIGEPKEMLPAKLTIINTANNNILFEHEWVFENIPTANWVENKMGIPNANDFILEFIRNQNKDYTSSQIHSIKLNNSYVLLRENHTSGIIIDASFGVEGGTVMEYSQRVIFMVYQKRNQKQYSNDISDWNFSNNLSTWGKLKSVYFHPTKIGDILILKDNDGMRGTELLGYKFYKFKFRQNYNSIYFEQVMLEKQYFELSMGREKLDFSYSMEKEGIRINKEMYKKGYDDWILVETKDEFVDFYNELNFN